MSPKKKEILMYLEEYHFITVKQCERLFFRDAERRNDRARKLLKEMEYHKDKNPGGELKSYRNTIRNEKIYYYDKKMDISRLLVHDFYSMIVDIGGENIVFKAEPQLDGGRLRPDAYFSFTLRYPDLGIKSKHFLFLEVDYKHPTDEAKLKRYDEIAFSGKIQKELQIPNFPKVVIAKACILEKDKRYKPKNFKISYTNYIYSNLLEEIIEINEDLQGYLKIPEDAKKYLKIS